MNGDERMHDHDDDYLWDRSGAVDPGIARLERLLGAYAHADMPRHLHRATSTKSQLRPRRRWRIAFAVAAVLALCALGTRAWYQQRLQWDAGRPWQVVAQRGDVRIDGRRTGTRAALALDALLETGADTVARLRAAGIGEIAVGEDSRLRLVETRTGRHRLQLQQGSLWTRVWAPPGQLGVDVPGADILDLGCEFLLEVDADGNGSLAVRSGWVQIETRRREVLVPQGTRVRLRANGDAGTPYDSGAGAEFVKALDAIDARGGDVDARGDEVRRLVAASRPQDAISLLSLLQAHPSLADGPLFGRMAGLLPQIPASRAAWDADRDAQLDAWRHALPYPRIKRWWTQWPDALPVPDNKLEALLRSSGPG